MKAIRQRMAFIGLSAIFVMYLYLLVKIILFKFGTVNLPFLWDQLVRSVSEPSRMLFRLQEGNLMPFDTIAGTIRDITVHNMVNLLGNIALFVPFGALLAMMAGLRHKLAARSAEKRVDARPRAGFSLFAAMLRGFEFSLVLEISQVVFSMGIFDVDDLILNTAGAMLGCILYLTVTAAVPKRRPIHKRLSNGGAAPDHLDKMVGSGG